MTPRQRGHRQANVDFEHDGYMPSWQLVKYPAEFQTGYRVAQNEIETQIDVAAQARIFD